MVTESQEVMEDAIDDEQLPDKLELSEEETQKLLSVLKQKFDAAWSLYYPTFRRMRLMDAIDKGYIWKALNAKLPSYQILPDTNDIKRTKQNLLASLYTVAKSAQVVPTSEEDIPLVEQINVAMEHLWDTLRVPMLQFQAGSRAALHNYGLTQVGWDKDAPAGKEKGNIALLDVDTMRFMREPESTSLATAEWCCKWDTFNKTFFLEDERYREKFKTAEARAASSNASEIYNQKIDDRPQNTSSNTYTLIVFWRRELFEDKIIYSEYHTLNAEVMLWKKRDIRPARFPFAELYCNLPEGSLIGTSECATILSNSVAYNLMNSMALTLEYKRFHPPKFINQQSNLNVATFTKHGDDPDRAFIVTGDARQAVHYHEYPALSAAVPALTSTLKYDMQEVTGVDARYTGRDTGSIITTGGTEEMLNRVTLIDAPKIMNYENYCRDLTELILLNLGEFNPKRTYLIKGTNDFGQDIWLTHSIDLTELFKNKEDWNTLFYYAIDISSELPKNKQRTAALANMVMEQQRQYAAAGETVDLITPEEWLRSQDFPHKEQWLKRMGIQRQMDVLLETSAIVAEYAELVNSGIDPEQALMQTAASSGSRQFGQPGAGMGGVSPDGSTAVVPSQGMGMDMGMGMGMPGGMPGGGMDPSMMGMDPMMGGGGGAVDPTTGMPIY